MLMTASKVRDKVAFCARKVEGEWDVVNAYGRRVCILEKVWPEEGALRRRYRARRQRASAVASSKEAAVARLLNKRGELL